MLVQFLTSRTSRARPRRLEGRACWNCDLIWFLMAHNGTDKCLSARSLMLFLPCSNFRPDRKVKALLHTRGRRGVSENSNARCANANGWVETAGRTLANSALSVTSTSIHTSRDRWTSQTGSTCRIKPRNILKISARNARALAITAAGLNRVKKIRP